MAEQRSDDILRARRESAELIGIDVERLGPADTLRCDMISALRIVIDSEQANVVDGGRADLGRLVLATEQLIKLLPERQLAVPEQPDDRDAAVQPLLKLYRYLHETVATLTAENAQLKAALGAGHPSVQPGVSQHRGQAENSVSGHLCGSITPPTSDIVPACERAECDAGPRAGVDDLPPRSTRIIEGKAVPKSKPAPPPSFDDTPGGKAWQDWYDAGGSVGGGDRWSNRNIP